MQGKAGIITERFTLLSTQQSTNQPIQQTKKRGRPKGSLNRRSQQARDIVERMKCDPLEYLMSIVKNRRLPIELRLDAAKTATPFVHARLSTTAVMGQVNHDVSVISKIQQISRSDSKIAGQMEAIALALAAPPNESEPETRDEDIQDAEFTPL